MMEKLNHLAEVWLWWIAACFIEAAMVIKTLDEFLGDHNVLAGGISLIGCCAMGIVVLRLRRKYHYLYNDWMRS